MIYLHQWSVLILAVVALPAWTRPAAAEDVPWRHDYKAARTEAADAGRPLILEFSSAHCSWCRKMRTTTFRDPVVADLMSRQFVPLEMSGAQKAALEQALGIDAYPTVVLASPDGRVLDVVQGYAAPAEFAGRLQRVLAAMQGDPGMR